MEGEGEVVEDVDDDVDDPDGLDDWRFISSSSAFFMHSRCASSPVRFLQTCLASSSSLDGAAATLPEVFG